ncbi:MAG: polysaccharide biosynthesis C-terminal domain-containing protein, partial [Oscillospiraceae bacterium]|nr:polysaccharide biosynthesis C-terminal domain-containing protein [Oscillospiraceae bacterium]
FACTRLVAECEAKGQSGANAVLHCALYALGLSFTALLLLLLLSRIIAVRFIGDIRALPALRVLAFTLPPIAVSSALAGGFVACGRGALTSFSQCVEQLIRIGITVFIFSRSPFSGLTFACAAVSAGAVAGELASLLAELPFFIIYKRREKISFRRSKTLFKKLFAIILPLSAAAWVRSALSTVQQLLIPRGLEKAGASSSKALSDYGLITGIVFPLITFPQAFFIVLGELIGPELTRAQVLGDSRTVSALLFRTLRFCFVLSVGAAGILFTFADGWGRAVYSSGEAGAYIRLLSPLMVAMYMDSITDGMLRGLGEHVASMRLNIADSALSLVLIILLLPRFAAAGYIAVLYFSECFNLAFSLRRLLKISGLRLRTAFLPLPPACMAGAVSASVFFLKNVRLSLSSPVFSLALGAGFAAILYAALMFAVLYSPMKHKKRRVA